MNEAARCPFDLLYADKVVSVIMIDGCSFSILTNWLAQTKLIPGRPAYTPSSNDLIDMMNSGSLPIDANKQKPKKGKKKGGDETIGAIIKSVDDPIDTLPLNVTQQLMMIQKVKIPIHLMRLSFQWMKNQTSQVN